jgi:hypothetical protein
VPPPAPAGSPGGPSREPRYEHRADRFWICPATLVFDRAWNLTTDINLQGRSFQLFLDAIERSGPDEHGFFEWTLAGDHFSIGLSAPGFTQYLRHVPIRSPGYWLSVDERGGFSFDQEGYIR